MAGEHEPESTRARLAQHDRQRQTDGLREYQQRMASGHTSLGQGAFEAQRLMAMEAARAELDKQPDVNVVGSDYDAGPHGGVLHGSVGMALCEGVAMMPRAPCKMFSRETILAVLKAQKCLNDTHKVSGMRDGGADVLRSLITIFENLE